MMKNISTDKETVMDKGISKQQVADLSYLLNLFKTHYKDSLLKYEETYLASCLRIVDGYLSTYDPPKESP